MGSKRFQRMLETISGALDPREIPYALMGAFALNLYGVRRYAEDLDLIADRRHRGVVKAGLEKAGFHCRNETETFARFESEIDFYGRVECMFIRTREGRDMLDRRVLPADSDMGSLPVVQLSDYIMLKLVAMANQPGRIHEDEADIRSVLECYRQDRIPAWCGAPDRDRIEQFAGKIGQELTVQRLFKEALEPSVPEKAFAL